MERCCGFAGHLATLAVEDRSRSCDAVHKLEKLQHLATSLEESSKGPLPQQAFLDQWKGDPTGFGRVVLRANPKSHTTHRYVLALFPTRPNSPFPTHATPTTPVPMMMMMTSSRSALSRPSPDDDDDAIT
ncbi:hypothetical protein HPB51_002539 [Rhipicephalus microplus]|uniref:Uncharacterized protein n=1 Tax=Rhipicephalus microplus TaxID=6941 RepID=A0A9J6DF86_RHIMP|nr:hypothetical protein HPB51_002539 [Rhipicephalus microplus]